MATTTAVTPTTSTSDTTSYTSASFTPAASDLIVVFVATTGSVSTGKASMTDSQGLGFTLVTFARKNTSADSVYMFVANALAAASAMTVTFACSDDSATGCIISPLRISGMSRVGLAAIRQTQTVFNGAAGTPAPAFAASCLTGNVTLGFVANAANPATIAEPAGWTEAADVGYATPTTGVQTVYRDSGFTGTTVTWGGTTGSAYALLLAELDTSVASGLYPDAVSAASAAIVTGTSLSVTHVIGSGSDMALFAVVGIIDNTTNRDLVTGVTYNGTAMKYLGRMEDRGGSEMINMLYVLVAPSTGSHSITVNLAADCSISSSVVDLAGVSFAGVHQTYPYRLLQTQCSGLTSSTTLTLSSTDASASDGDWVVGGSMSHSSGYVPAGTQLIVANHQGMNNGGAQGWGVGIKNSAIGTTMTWTQSASDVWSACGIAVRPATATPTMPVMDQAGQSVRAGGASSATITNFTVTNASNGLLLFWAIYTTTTTINVSGVTWNGHSLTKLDAQRVNNGGTIMVTELWYWKGPEAATSNLVATFSAAVTSFTGHAQAWNLVDQSSTFGTVAKLSDLTDTAGTYTFNVSSSTSAVVVAGFWLKSDTIGYPVPAGSELHYYLQGTGGSGVLGQVQGKIGAATVAMGGAIGAGGGTSNISALGVGLNFSAAGGGTITMDMWGNRSAEILIRRMKGMVPSGTITIKN